jgi:hypothetical protein
MPSSSHLLYSNTLKTLLESLKSDSKQNYPANLKLIKDKMFDADPSVLQTISYLNALVYGGAMTVMQYLGVIDLDIKDIEGLQQEARDIITKEIGGQ